MTDSKKRERERDRRTKGSAVRSFEQSENERSRRGGKERGKKIPRLLGPSFNNNKYVKASVMVRKASTHTHTHTERRERERDERGAERSVCSLQLLRDLFNFFLYFNVRSLCREEREKGRARRKRGKSCLMSSQRKRTCSTSR